MAVNTPADPKDVRSFKKRRTITYITWIAGAFFWAMMISSLRYPNNNYTALPKNIEPWALFGIGFILFIVSYFVWRCPVCHKFLGITTATTKCRKCNTVFEQRR